jgi:hypothetical protein
LSNSCHGRLIPWKSRYVLNLRLVGQPLLIWTVYGEDKISLSYRTSSPVWSICRQVTLPTTPFHRFQNIFCSFYSRINPTEYSRQFCVIYY